jgi:hypothetical protein
MGRRAHGSSQENTLDHADYFLKQAYAHLCLALPSIHFTRTSTHRLHMEGKGAGAARIALTEVDKAAGLHHLNRALAFSGRARRAFSNYRHSLCYSRYYRPSKKHCYCCFRYNQHCVHLCCPRSHCSCDEEEDRRYLCEGKCESGCVCVRKCEGECVRKFKSDSAFAGGGARNGVGTRARKRKCRDSEEDERAGDERRVEEEDRKKVGIGARNHKEGKRGGRNGRWRMRGWSREAHTGETEEGWVEHIRASQANELDEVGGGHWRQIKCSEAADESGCVASLDALQATLLYHKSQLLRALAEKGGRGISGGEREGVRVRSVSRRVLVSGFCVFLRRDCLG